MLSRGSRTFTRNRLSKHSRAHSDSVLFVKKRSQKHSQLSQYHCRVCLLDRTEVKAKEEYSKEKASMLIEKHLNCRTAHCMMYFMPDRIELKKTKTFGINPPRNFIEYKSIECLTTFENYPFHFMLFICHEKSHKKSYETYKVKSLEDIQIIQDVILRAHNTNSLILRYNQISERITRSTETPIHSQSLSLSELHAHKSDLDEPSTSFKITESHLDQKSAILSYSAPLLKTSVNNLSDNMEANSVHMNENWQVNISYYRFDPLLGIVENDCGPIYMYFARQIHHANDKPNFDLK